MAMASSRPMWMRTAFPVVAALILAACSPAPATEAASPAEGTPGDMQVVLEDDFSEAASGWNVVETDTQAIQYQDGQLRVFADNDSSAYVFRVAYLAGDYADVRIEVDVRQASGDPAASQALVCRYQDGEHYVFADADFEGNLRIGRFLAGEQEVVQDFEGFAGLQAGTNHLRLDCIGSLVEFYVNGELAASAEISQPASGGVGLYAGGSGQGQNEFFFDNFIVYQP